MRVVAVIPARQWSVGTPGKNRDGFENALQAALAVATAGIYVTTDDPVLEDTRATMIARPRDLADGDTGAVIAHAVADVQADVVVVLQPSSPARQRTLYCLAAVRVLMDDPEATSVVSVVPWDGEPPQKAVTKDADGYLRIPAPVRRQDCPATYRRDGTVYAVRMTYAKGGDLYGPRPVPLLVTPRDSVTVD